MTFQLTVATDRLGRAARWSPASSACTVPPTILQMKVSMIKYKVGRDALHRRLRATTVLPLFRLRKNIRSLERKADRAAVTSRFQSRTFLLS